MKICVAGGAGFIGSNFIHYMINKYRDIQIVCIDNLTYAGNLENLEAVRENTNFKFYRGSILDNKFLDSVFLKEDFDILVNFVEESQVTDKLFLETNIIGVKNLMDMCLKHNLRRYHQVSTGSVYGNLPIDSDKSFFEDDILVPSSPYLVSKSSADMLVLSYFKNFDLSITISRCSNNYGPYQYPKNFIPTVIASAINDEKIVLYKNYINDWIHVYDHVIAIDKIIRDGKLGEVYNISANNEIDNFNLVKNILDILNKDYSLIEKSKEGFNSSLKSSINNDKIKDELFFKCSIEFEKGLKDTVNWYLNNLNWVETVLRDKYLEV